MNQRKKTYGGIKPNEYVDWFTPITKEGDLALDPFIGSGTTSIVSKKLKRNSIGIDNKE